MHVHMPMRAYTHVYAHPLSLSVRVTDRVVPFCESENVPGYDLELAQLALDADVNDGHVYLILVILTCNDGYVGFNVPCKRGISAPHISFYGPYGPMVYIS